MIGTDSSRARRGAVGLAAAACLVAAAALLHDADPPAPPDHGIEGAPRPAPVATALERERGPTTRVASRPFDPAAGAEAGAAADVAAAPVPPTHRRVAVTVAFDDGAALADVEADVRSVEEAADDAEREAWGDAARTVSLKLDSEGRGSVVVPKGAAFALYGGGGTEHPPFLTPAAPAGASEVRLVIPANPLVVDVVDERGAPFPGVAMQATGRGTGGSGYGTLVSDAAGRATFRGFVTEISVQLEASSPRETTGVVVLTWNGEPSRAGGVSAPRDYDPPCRVAVVARRLPVVVGRILDPEGMPVAAAWAEVVGRVAGRPQTIPFGGARTGPTGRWAVVIPRDGREISLNAVVTTVAVTLIAPNLAPQATLERHGSFGAETIDFGDATIVRPRTLRFRPIDAAGRAVEGATLGVSDGASTIWDESRVVREEGGVLAWCARPEDRNFVIAAEGFLDAEFTADADGPPGFGPVRDVVLSRGGVLRIAAPPGGAGDFSVQLSSNALLGSRLGAVFDGNGGHLLVAGRVDAEVAFEFTGLRPGVPSKCVFLQDDVVYAETIMPPFVADETRTLVAPAPPVRATLAGTLRRADGSFIEGGVRLSRDGTAIIEFATDDAGRAQIEGVPEGRYVIEGIVDGVAAARREIEVKAPETTFALVVAPLRTVVLRVKDVPRDLTESLVVDAEASDGGHAGVSGRLEDSVSVFEVRVRGDATATFLVALGEWRTSVVAPPGADEVEARAPAYGRLVIDVGASAATEVVDVFVDGAPGDGPTFIAKLYLPPSEERRRFGTYVLRPGRRRIEFSKADGSRFGGLPPKEPGPPVAPPRVAEVRPGEATVVALDF